MFTLKTGLPQSVGISSESICAALKELEYRQIPMHSFLLCRYDTLVAEGYYAPCSREKLHRMFSVTKSFVSAAIGLLAQDGLLQLDDPIINYFPEYLPEPVHPWLKETTIRDMLSMRSCHASTTYNKFSTTENWVESFFTVPPTHKPGTVFHYDTSATHTLCALVEKLTGQSLLDYLRTKVLDDIGFSREAYCLKDPFGVSMGGSGLMATSRDLMLFGLLILHGGSLGGRQYLPADYVRQATSFQTATCVTGPVPAESQGYGYQFWMGEQESVVCYGMGGQLVIMLPRYDTVIVTTADTQGYQGGNQAIYDAIFRHILPELQAQNTSPVSPERKDPDFQDYMKNLQLRPLSAGCSPLCTRLQSSASGSAVHYTLQGHPLFTSVSFEADQAKGSCTFYIEEKPCTLSFGFGRLITSRIPLYDMECAASASWLSNNCLYIKIHLLDTSVGSIHIQTVFGDNDVTIFMRKQEETLFSEFAGHFFGRRIPGL